MPIPVEKLLELIPSDTQQRVERAKNRLNLAIREGLRQETALRLSRNDSDAIDPYSMAGSRDSQVIRVRLVPGLPVSLHQRQIDDAHLVAILLAPWTQSLTQLRDSTRTILKEMRPSLEREEVEPGDMVQRTDSLQSSNALAEDLLKKFFLSKIPGELPPRC